MMYTDTKINKKSFLFVIIGFACTWYFFFASSFTVRPYPQLFWIGMAAISVLFALIHNHKLSKVECLFFLGMTAILIISLFSSDPYDSFLTVANYVIYFVVARMVAKNCSAQTVMRLILGFTLVHLACIFIQVFIPDVYSAYILPLLPERVHTQILEYALYSKSYFGFSVQTSMSAMYLCIGLILCALKLRNSSKTGSKLLYAVLSVLFVVGAFYTTRRGSIAVIFIIAALIYFKSKGSAFSKLLLVLTVLLFVSLIGLENIPGLGGVLDKFETLIGRGSIMNGREKSFVRAFGIFLNKPVFGHGIGQIDNALGYAWLENSYILALVEGGIIGAFALFTPYYVAIKDTVTALKNKAANNHYVLFAVYIQIMFVLMSVIENYFANPLNSFLFYLAFFASQKALEEAANGVAE